MNIRNIIAALALLGLTGAGANAQNRYVSQDAATVLGSDKYYISMAGEQSGGTAWTLDEKEKTWSSEGGSSGALNFGKLTFKKQYSCKVDGKPFYYDEYSSSTGMSVNLFYDSGKVSAIEISSMGQVVMAMWLHSCSARIPSSMYFTLTPSWRASDGSKTPPTASEAWKDTAASNELACGTRTDALVVTDRKPLGTGMDRLVHHSGCEEPFKIFRHEHQGDCVRHAFLQCPCILQVLPEEDRDGSCYI